MPINKESIINGPLVSVLIAAYNHENYVQAAINSVISQTYSNIELIIVDDGSTDGTWHKIEEMRGECEERFCRFYAETKDNEGTCSTFNKLLEYAKGKYVVFFASDDMFKEEAIVRLVDILEKNGDYIAAVGDNEIIDAQGTRIGWNERMEACTLSSCKYETFAQLLKVSQVDFGSYECLAERNHIPNGCLIRLSALKKILPFTKDAPLEDYFMHLQLSKLGRYFFVDDILFSYRWHNDNTAKKRDKMVQMTIKTLLYEEKLTYSMDNKYWYNVFKEKNHKVNNILSMGNYFKFYKVKHIDCKEKVFEIFGRKFVFKKSLF